jgi:hypothetical protein
MVGAKVAAMVEAKVVAEAKLLPETKLQLNLKTSIGHHNLVHSQPLPTSLSENDKEQD